VLRQKKLRAGGEFARTVKTCENTTVSSFNNVRYDIPPKRAVGGVEGTSIARGEKIERHGGLFGLTGNFISLGTKNSISD